MNSMSIRSYLPAFAALVFCLSAHAAPDRAHVVNVYAWSDYFPQSVVAKFQSDRKSVV